jgi:hypothetical protein
MRILVVAAALLCTPVIGADTAVPGAFPAGHACLTGRECKSGQCEGRGCDAKHPGACAPEGRLCPRNHSPFCGCDGKTFFQSSACPGRRYRYDGSCAGDVDQSPLIPER